MSAINNFAWFLTELKKRLRVGKIAEQSVYVPLDQFEDLDDYLTRLVHEFITASPESRRDYQLLFEDGDAAWYVSEFIGHLCSAIQVDSHEDRLRTALIAASFIRNNTGPYDFVCRLGWIYRAARKAGIADPIRVFKDVAHFINECGNDLAPKSMSEFDKSEIFRIAESKTKGEFDNSRIRRRKR